MSLLGYSPVEVQTTVSVTRNKAPGMLDLFSVLIWARVHGSRKVVGRGEALTPAEAYRAAQRQAGFDAKLFPRNMGATVYKQPRIEFNETFDLQPGRSLA